MKKELKKKDQTIKPSLPKEKINEEFKSIKTGSVKSFIKNIEKKIELDKKYKGLKDARKLVDEKKLQISKKAGVKAPKTPKAFKEPVNIETLTIPKPSLKKVTKEQSVKKVIKPKAPKTPGGIKAPKPPKALKKLVNIKTLTIPKPAVKKNLKKSSNNERILMGSGDVYIANIMNSSASQEIKDAIFETFKVNTNQLLNLNKRFSDEFIYLTSSKDGKNIPLYEKLKDKIYYKGERLGYTMMIEAILETPYIPKNLDSISQFSRLDEKFERIDADETCLAIRDSGLSGRTQFAFNKAWTANREMITEIKQEYTSAVQKILFENKDNKFILNKDNELILKQKIMDMKPRNLSMLINKAFENILNEKLDFILKKAFPPEKITIYSRLKRSIKSLFDKPKKRQEIQIKNKNSLTL